MGIGLTVIDPEDVQSLRGSGMTTGVWSLIAPIVAMFVGGLAAAPVAGPMPPLGAVIHGAVVWSLATVASTVLVVALVASIVGRVASAELTREAGAMTGAMNQNAGVTTDLPGRDNDQVRERTGAMRRNEARRNQAQGTELRAAEATGKGLLGLFVAMLLGLLAALGGAIFGDARERRLLTRTT
jgi:hypothetical protein